MLPEYTGLGPNPSPRVLWLRIKTCCQSTLAQAKDLLPEYSGTGPNPSPRVLWQKVLWDRLKSLSQSTLGGGYEPLPEYSGRALQSEDYHLKAQEEMLNVGWWSWRVRAISNRDRDGRWRAGNFDSDTAGSRARRDEGRSRDTER